MSIEDFMKGVREFGTPAQQFLKGQQEYGTPAQQFLKGIQEYGYPGFPTSVNKLNTALPPADASKQPPTPAVTEQKRIDEDSSLKLIPFEALNTSQKYANAGDTMPIVFCKRVSGQGGVWISPPLLEAVSNDFVHTFVYLVTHGQATLNNTYDFIGNQAFADITPAGSVLRVQGYTNNPATCPLGFGASCDHSTFKFITNPLAATVGNVSRTRTINNYTTGVTIKAKPLYPDGLSSPTALERYTLTVQRINNSTGATATVGTFITSATGGISSISDTPTAGNYTYSVINTAVHTASTDKPETILLEFVQSNTFPTSYDRTSSYTNITLKIIRANLYDLSKEFSAPSDLKQVHIFMDEGVQVTKWRWLNPADPSASSPPYAYTTAVTASDIFADLINYWFVNGGKFPNQNFQNFALEDIAETAIFHENYNMRFNGYISTGTNFISWAQTVAPFFLCSFTSIVSTYGLVPVLPLNSSRQIHPGSLQSSIKETFNDTDVNVDSLQNSIIAGTYRRIYKNTQERVPFQVVTTWRGQNAFNLETAQTTTVRYSDYAATAPEEAYDMTSFCTNADHATLFAKYVLATRRYSTHSVSFQTARNTFSTSELQVYDLIAVSLSRVDSAGDNRTETEYYLVDALEYDQTGIATITATHFPLNGSYIGVINDSILNGSFVVTT
jgi:hypothetical protein